MYQMQQREIVNEIHEKNKCPKECDSTTKLRATGIYTKVGDKGY